MPSGPRFTRFFWPILAALRELGGSARPREVVDLVLDSLAIGDDERAERTKSGSLRVANQVHWARNYLVWAGLLDGSQRGRWALSSEGWTLPLNQQDQASALRLFKRVRAEHASDWGQQSGAGEEDPDSEEAPVPLDEAESGEIALTAGLRSTVLALSPAGFENLCKRLLTELGLVQLRTIGQAGDRGIDVEGHLRVNAVVSFRVGVQCKLYSDGNKVTPRQIREFQGALGPYDRGIFMTTSVFTPQAEEQAGSAGYKPIDLIDGERLIELLQEHGLGLRHVTLVDETFFEPFR
ncbi:MAG TPA: restriction endonuclease [Acidimicrobiales bacterium]|nr:restriction endonuclease [Acidimicrobiales bacterium]